MSSGHRYWGPNHSEEDAASHSKLRDKAIKQFYSMSGARSVTVRPHRRIATEDMQNATYYGAGTSPTSAELHTSYEEYNLHTIEVDEDSIIRMNAAIRDRDTLQRFSDQLSRELDEKLAQIRGFESVVTSNDQLRRTWGELLTMCKLHGLKNHPFQ